VSYFRGRLNKVSFVGWSPTLQHVSSALDPCSARAGVFLAAPQQKLTCRGSLLGKSWVRRYGPPLAAAISPDATSRVPAMVPFFLGSLREPIRGHAVESADWHAEPPYSASPMCPSSVNHPARCCPPAAGHLLARTPHSLRCREAARNASAPTPLTRRREQTPAFEPSSLHVLTWPADRNLRAFPFFSSVPHESPSGNQTPPGSL